MNRSWIELDFSALRNNIRLYQQYLPQGCKIMGVIKANAYGHGARTVALALEEMGIDFFAVATIDEAVEIRESGIKSDILILGFTDPLCFQTLLEYHLTQTITDSAYGHLIEDYCKKAVPLSMFMLHSIRVCIVLVIPQIRLMNLLISICQKMCM
jgi:serine/alanine racemase